MVSTVSRFFDSGEDTEASARRNNETLRRRRRRACLESIMVYYNVVLFSRWQSSYSTIYNSSKYPMDDDGRYRIL
jgi:hypothetical protein